MRANAKEISPNQFQQLINQRVTELKEKSQNIKQKETEKSNPRRINEFYEKILAIADIPSKLKRESFKSYDCSVKEGFEGKVALVRKFAQSYQNPENIFLYLGGNVGNGKSHLAVSAAKVIAYQQAKELDAKIDRFMPSKLPNGEVFLFYVNWRSEIKKIRNSYSNRSSNYSALEVIQKMQRAKVLVIDDLFARSKISSSDLDDIFEIVDYRYQRDKLTIFTSNKFPGEYLTSLTPEDLKDNRYNRMNQDDLDIVTDRIASRILHGCGSPGVVEFDGPNYRVVSNR
ncbi:hypothetical protein [Natroniella sp. ANB-PHB2]|uniref:hypothetical protein n=1 Tax=Natroniella sp. ANB-PHB2 TaxID=3384444 RepID=UPI0038D3B931